MHRRGTKDVLDLIESQTYSYSTVCFTQNQAMILKRCLTLLAGVSQGLVVTRTSKSRHRVMWNVDVVLAECCINLA